MLIIVNPYATTVSDRLKNLVIYALQGRFEVEVEATESQDHATEIGRDARDGGYDIVVAFGGDGTVNEVVNGLAGTDIPVAFLPGGNTNVVCRTLGIPNDVVDATEHLLSLADDFNPRKIDLGMVDDRYFVFSCGAGIDASVVRKVDAKPKLKASAGPWFYSWKTLSTYTREYMRNPVRLGVEVGGETCDGVTVLAQIHVCPNVKIDDGSLSLVVLERANQLDALGIVPRLLSSRLPTEKHSRARLFEKVMEARVHSLPREGEAEAATFPVQVDGDFIGDFTEVTLKAAPAALSIIA
jgi:diacylglycerol kinase family enzyme